MRQISNLIENAEEYIGEYVTVADEKSTKVICHGKDVSKIYEETQRMGYKDPVIIYIPEDGETYVYSEKNEQPTIDTYA